MAKNKSKQKKSAKQKVSNAARITELEKRISALESMMQSVLAHQAPATPQIHELALSPAAEQESTLYQVRAEIAKDVGRDISQVGAGDPLDFFYRTDGALRDFYIRKINGDPFNCRPPVTLADVSRSDTVNTLSQVVDARRTS